MTHCCPDKPSQNYQDALLHSVATRRVLFGFLLPQLVGHLGSMQVLQVKLL